MGLAPILCWAPPGCPVRPGTTYTRLATAEPDAGRAPTSASSSQRPRGDLPAPVGVVGFRGLSSRSRLRSALLKSARHQPTRAQLASGAKLQALPSLTGRGALRRSTGQPSRLHSRLRSDGRPPSRPSCWSDLLGGVALRSTALHDAQVFVRQFSTFSFCTRRNSRSLLVTRMSPRLTPWAAMSVSRGSMGRPSVSSRARTRA